MLQERRQRDRLCRRWWQAPHGQAFARLEAQVLHKLLPRLTGYRCMQVVGSEFDSDMLEATAPLCRWRIGLSVASQPDICFDGRHLPLATASVDALILSHGLEQVEAPHVLLRECARALNDRGQLIVLAFNPLSPWWWRQHLLVSRRARYLPQSVPPRADRLCDWLRLLAFEPEELWRYGYGFPGYGRFWQPKTQVWWLRTIAWTAQAYVVFARKQVAPRMPLPERRRRQTGQPAGALARNTVNRVESRR